MQIQPGTHPDVNSLGASALCEVLHLVFCRTQINGVATPRFRLDRCNSSRLQPDSPKGPVVCANVSSDLRNEMNKVTAKPKGHMILQCSCNRRRKRFTERELRRASMRPAQNFEITLERCVEEGEDEEQEEEDDVPDVEATVAQISIAHTETGRKEDEKRGHAQERNVSRKRLRDPPSNDRHRRKGFTPRCTACY